jgi:uncharacterized protein (DUF2141 family)
MQSLKFLLLLLYATAAAKAAATVVPIFGEPKACAVGAPGPAALVRVHGFKDRKGQLRVIVYRSNEAEFLASGKFIARIDTPLTPAGDMTVCVPLPEGGPLIVVALHDRDKNGKFGAFEDGVGFSNNPRLGLSKPKLPPVTTSISGVAPLSIELNYMRGFRPQPVRAK